MAERLAEAFAQTDYRVRLPRGGYASLRVDVPLPATLWPVAGAADWGVITAWNPGSQVADQHGNRLAQRLLLTELRRLPTTRYLQAAIGVGREGWFERSLFVVGPDEEALRRLCRQHGQLACVTGQATGPARLTWARPA